uniref:Uncharacterized protein n=1 Tax=Oryza barthii TaxID=65489 RepID=A0A0D3FRS1_9ORYZ
MIHLLIHGKKKNAQNLPICRNPLPFFLRARGGTVGHRCPSPPYVGGVSIVNLGRLQPPSASILEGRRRGPLVFPGLPLIPYPAWSWVLGLMD